MYSIRYIGDPVLRKKAGKVETFDEDLTKFISDMVDVVHREDGLGLAAPQIGVSRQILVLDVSPIIEDEEPRAFINPEISNPEGEKVLEEGCLSIPGVHEEVTRPAKITLTWQDETGKTFTQDFDGWLARVLQHEIDHLNGILFVDHISPVKRQMLKNQKLIPETY